MRISTRVRSASLACSRAGPAFSVGVGCHATTARSSAGRSAIGTTWYAAAARYVVRLARTDSSSRALPAATGQHCRQCKRVGPHHSHSPWLSQLPEQHDAPGQLDGSKHGSPRSPQAHAPVAKSHTEFWQSPGSEQSSPGSPSTHSLTLHAPLQHSLHPSHVVPRGLQSPPSPPAIPVPPEPAMPALPPAPELPASASVPPAPPGPPVSPLSLPVHAIDSTTTTQRIVGLTWITSPPVWLRPHAPVRLVSRSRLVRSKS